MEGSVSSVTLRCLNCGANLRIEASIVEFACEYCGAPQIVQRDGGTVSLRILSARVDQIKDTVDRTAAEVSIHGLNVDLEEIEEKYNQLEVAQLKQKEMITQLFWLFLGVVCIPGLVASAYSGSFVPVVLFAVLGGVGLYFLRRRIVSGMDNDFKTKSVSVIDKGVEIKKRINDYEKIVNASKL